jgi:two-component system, NarL family, nitrate/nitrite response regulator NarL
MFRSPVILVHPSRLFSEGLAKICEGGLFQLTYVGTSVDCLSLDMSNSECAPVFVVGGKSSARTVENIRLIRSHHKSSVIVVVGDSSDACDVTPALDAGANCYLRETINAELLLKTLDLFTNDEVVLPAHSRQPPNSEDAQAGAELPEPLLHPPFLQPTLALSNGDKPAEALAEPQEASFSEPTLSAREEAILRGLVEGHPNKVIANSLNITEATVKVHVKAILRKIRAKNRTQAAIWAVKHSLTAVVLS